jgi:hypothetical protein
VTDLDRLGKPGAYRLGRLRAQGLGEVARPAPFRPSFARPRHRGPLALWLAAWLTGTGLVAVGAMTGMWLLPYLAGLLAGFATGAGRWRIRPVLIASASMTVVGWGAPLGLAALHGPLTDGPAHAVTAETGLPAHSVAGFAVAMLVAVAQALAGVWLGRVLAPRRPDRI